jgi:hypothetical protein
VSEAIARHTLNLGAVFSNLLSLDFILRVAIEWLEERRPIVGPYRECEWISRTPVTDPASLWPMLERFNELVPDPGDRLDSARLVRLRDAVAHGRMYAPEPETPLTLVKFGLRPDSQDRIHVDTVLRMTDEWFAEQRAFTNDALMRAAKYASGPTHRGSI